MTTVVNMHKTDGFDVYIGRIGGTYMPDPPHRGCFGNPYRIGEYSRTECIRLFKEYFLKRIEKDEVFRTAVLALQGKRLGCFCKPRACHGDVIKEWLDAHGDDLVVQEAL